MSQVISQVTASAGTLATNAQGLTGTPSISVVDITSRHINSSGVVTATSFVGDGSGLTGLSGGISGISTTGTSVFNQLNVSGISTFSKGGTIGYRNSGSDLSTTDL